MHPEDMGNTFASFDYNLACVSVIESFLGA
jgi:hypothetical protein